MRRVTPSSSTSSTVMALPSLFYLAFLLAFAAIDYLANRPNRLANSLDPRP